MRAKYKLEIIFLIVTNGLILVSSIILSNILNHSPVVKIQNSFLPFYILGFLGVGMNLFVLLSGERIKALKLGLLKIVLALFVFIHVIVNSVMFYIVMSLVQL